MPIIRPTDEEYAQYAKNSPHMPLWQSLEWKRYQEALGRETRLYSLVSNSSKPLNLQTSKPLNLQTSKLRSSALVIIDRTSFGFSTWNIPRGPIGESPEAIEKLLRGIIKEAKEERCIAVYFSPLDTLSLSQTLSRIEGRRGRGQGEGREFPLYEGKTNPLPTLSLCEGRGYSMDISPIQLSSRYEQPEATLILDLAKSDDELLAEMTQKCRYNVRLAQKKGVTATESRDVDAFYELLKMTALRDGFTIHAKDHYEKFLTCLPGSFLLLACLPNLQTSKPLNLQTHNGLEARSTPLAALLGVIHKNTGIYYYGASDNAHRALMAPYLLQWEAMRCCRDKGCTKYDLLGIAPTNLTNPMDKGQGTKDKGQTNRTNLQTSKPLNLKHPWSSITRFKLQFGGSMITYPPEREVVLRPIVKWVIGWKRRVMG